MGKENFYDNSRRKSSRNQADYVGFAILDMKMQLSGCSEKMKRSNVEKKFKTEN
jgi:hypothetical protein